MGASGEGKRSGVSRRRFLQGAGALAASPAAARAAANGAEDRRPNVVFIYTDDQDMTEMGCYGGDVLSPHMDSLARDGMKFTRFYVSSAVCAPSRYNVLTGRYASRSERLQEKYPPSGHPNIGWEPQVYGERWTLPRVLQRAGYTTGMVGKWHQGTGGLNGKMPTNISPTDPDAEKKIRENYRRLLASIRECGFDYAASAYSHNPGAATRKDRFWWPEKLGCHNMEWVTSGALDFIERNQDEPFFLYMAPTLVHSPPPRKSMKADPRATWAGMLDEAPDVQPSRESVLRRCREAGIDVRTGYGHTFPAGVLWLDDGIGAVLNRLEELGLAENTMVIVASDNGNFDKFSCYEGGTHLPCVVRWPGVVPPGSECDGLVNNVDLARTIVDVCGAEPPPEMQVDGSNILSALRGGAAYNRRSIYLEVTMERAVVSGDNFKYIAVRYPRDIREQREEGVRFTHWGLKWSERHHTYGVPNRHPAYSDTDQLYDLDRDPEEKNNLAGDPAYADKLKEMKDMLRRYCEELPHEYGEFTG